MALTQGLWLYRNYQAYGEWYFSEISTYYLYAYIAPEIGKSDSNAVEARRQDAITEFETARRNLPPPEIHRIFRQKAMERIDGRWPQAISLALKGMARQVIDSPLTKLLQAYPLDLPLAAGEIKKALRHPRSPASFAVAITVGLLRAMEIGAWALLFAAAFWCMIRCGGKTGAGAHQPLWFWVMAVLFLYLFIVTAGPSANARLREQYVPFLLVLGAGGLRAINRTLFSRSLG
jgi:hypothetical protein